MNKPDWKDAPEWANWLAQDGEGQWIWLGLNRDPQKTNTWITFLEPRP